VIDQLGQFIERHGRGKVRFGGEAVPARADAELAAQIAPFLRGRISAKQRFIASFSDAPMCCNLWTRHAKELAFLGTSCPITLSAPRSGRCLCRGARARICSAEESDRHARWPSIAISTAPTTRRSRPGFAGAARCQPRVVLIPGMGMFSFGKNKTEARITGEFYTNAIHVMEGASLLGEGEVSKGDRREPRSARREWIRPASRCFRITWRCRRRRRSASSIGRWKRRRFAASRRRRN
jgi:rhamnose utilization protein RhaD (predicted bifunctional aldolase and dehydrogenase)